MTNTPPASPPRRTLRRAALAAAVALPLVLVADPGAAGARTLPPGICGPGLGADTTVKPYREMRNPQDRVTTGYLKCGDENWGLRHIDANHAPLTGLLDTSALKDCIELVTGTTVPTLSDGKWEYNYTTSAKEPTHWRVIVDPRRDNSVTTAFSTDQGFTRGPFARCLYPA